MNRADSEKYIYEYENKLNFLEATNGIVDLIDPLLFALPDVQETIRDFSKTSSLKTFDSICKFFNKTFKEMKNENIENYEEALTLLKHSVSRFFLREEQLPADVSKHFYKSNSDLPLSQLNAYDFSRLLSTDATLRPSGFSILTKNGDDTIYLNSDLDKRTLSTNQIIASIDHPNLPVEFVTTTFEVQNDGSITKICTDSRDHSHNEETYLSNE